LAGCAQPKNPAITAKPSSEELPVIPPPVRTIEATVIVEGRAAEPRVQLVPEFKQPELTAEEKQALGIEPIHFKFLPYSVLPFPPGSRVGNWYGGVEAGSHDYSRVWSLGSAYRGITGTTGWGGSVSAVDSASSRVSATYGARPGVGTAGPSSGIRVETDTEASRVAERKPRTEP
jgi:hypothetical protein